MYCCCCLANVSLPGIGGTIPESKPFFYVNVADIESLEVEVSYVACEYGALPVPRPHVLAPGACDNSAGSQLWPSSSPRAPSPRKCGAPRPLVSPVGLGWCWPPGPHTPSLDVTGTTEKIFEEKRELYDVYVDNQNVKTHHDHLQPLLKINSADREKYRRLNEQR